MPEMCAIRARPMIAAMSDKAGTDPVEENRPADPYGDVALGVECAWPQGFLAVPPVEERVE